jgi:hypothetical protein
MLLEKMLCSKTYLNAKNKPKKGNDFEQILKEMKEYPSKCLYNNATQIAKKKNY